MLTALLLLDRARTLLLEVAWRIAQAREPQPPEPEPKGEPVDEVEPDATP